MSFGGSSYRNQGRRGGHHFGGNRNSYGQSQQQDDEDGQLREGRFRGRGRNEPYGNQSRQRGRREGPRHWNNADRHETHRRDDNFAGVGQEESSSQSQGDRERPPPGLKGREIGMWYAKRSQAKKQKNEKQNRSVVYMDEDKQKNIERLLHNLKRDDQSEERDSASRTSASSSHWRPGKGEWGSPANPASDFSHPSSVKSEGGSDTFNSSMASTRFVYQSSAPTTGAITDDDSPPDSWEQHDASDTEMEIGTDGPSTASTTSLGEAFPVEVVKPTEENESSDEDDEDENPNSIGVVQLLKSQEQSDAFGQDDPMTDFVNFAVPESDNPKMDREMQETMAALNNNPKYTTMLAFRKKLPAFEMSQTIVETVTGSQAVVISGETGCGKTTQVPQFILDDYIQRGVGSQCRIICTQPRRISAISVAERVAAERCENVNAKGQSSVGYQIRLETRKPRTQGSILFCTTGIVLKMLERDPQLNRATHVIIDEIHERDLQSDFLMIILKDLLPKRPDLKVILMSATLNAQMFSQYYGHCPMLNIPGYTFPVTQYLLEETLELTNYTTLSNTEGGWKRRNRRKRSREELDMEEDYKVWCRNLRGRYDLRIIDILLDFDFTRVDLDLINHIINHICVKMQDGAILVFVPGWEEIKNLNEMIQKTPRYKSGSLRVIPLHSLMPTVNQREIFERPPPGVRKIVVATNIAETSITIDDVVYVIDCGKIKVKDFNPEMNLTSLESKFVSKANAKQRRGRAGRVQAGHCFHLFTDFHYQASQDYLPPEMLRTRLEELCLQIKLLKLGRIVPFISKAMQHPSMESVSHAVETLIELSALDVDENLLPLGYHLARLPMEPHTGKMILFGAMFSCLDPILTVAASLSFKDAFTIPLGKEELADKARKGLAMGSKSDHIMLVNAFNGWEASLKCRGSKRYCWEHFLSENTLQMLKDMKRQLADVLHDIGFLTSKDPKDPKANLNSDNQAMIRAVLCAGLYPNVAQVISPCRRNRQHKTVGMSIKDDSRASAHPKSVNSKESFFESKWMVFYHKLKTSKVYLHDSTMVSPYPLLFFGGKIDIFTENEQELVSVDNWVKFKASSSTARLVKDLRSQLDRVLTQKITKPGPTIWDKSDAEGAIMTAIADLITMEILGKGLPNDGSVGTPS